MSLFVTLLADLLVAALLVATIVTSLKLSRRIAKLKADESAMRTTISDLITATTTAERAIIGLRAALDDCDRTLAGRLDTAERSCADLALHVQAGEGVIARIGAIVSQMRVSAAAATVQPAARPVPAAPKAIEEDRPLRNTKPFVLPPLRAPEPVETAPDMPLASSKADRLAAALDAAQAIRARERMRAKAA